MQKYVSSISSIDLSKGSVGVSQIIKIQMFYEALSEILVNMHSPICPYLADFSTCVPPASQKISIFMICDAPTVPLHKSMGEILGTFFLHKYVFKTAVVMVAPL